MKEYGNIDVDDIFTSNPVDDWLELKEHQDPAPRTLETLKEKLKTNQNGTALQQFLDQRDISICDATVSDLFDYKDFLEKKGTSDREIKNKLSEISTFYTDLMGMNQTDSNPAGYVLSQVDLNTESPERNHITVEKMAGFLRSIPDPQIQAVALYLIKYGLRRGAALNTDLHCVHLDHPEYLAFLESQDIELHEQIRDKPDTIYVYGKFHEGEAIEGEKRTNGNKRENPAVLPIDSELKQALLQHLTIRPHTVAPHPLFVNRRPIGGEYSRMTGCGLYQHLIQKYAINYGITNENDSREDVDLHYFRHFFGTQMSAYRGDHDGALNDTLVKYIRGDKLTENRNQEDVLDAVYRHDNWGVNVRSEYVENIYTFGLFD